MASVVPAPRAVVIPTLSGEEVEVSTADLPDDVSELTDLMRDEQAPLSLWMQFAVRGAVTWLGLLLARVPSPRVPLLPRWSTRNR